ncbi:MAG: hypothetical protein IKF79_05315 [Methanosphaera sp.]|nr:hypothetical protein [Methanosphaera sp.]
MTENVIIKVEITDCNHCRFLNSSDTGENCNILRKGIQEGEWSNIDFQYDEGWRYKNCPLLHPNGYLRRNCGVKVLKGDVE